MNNNRNMRRCMACNAPRAAEVNSTSRNAETCGCSNADNILPVMAFVPMQELGEVYTECQALHAGTLFPVLDKPFSGKGCY